MRASMTARLRLLEGRGKRGGAGVFSWHGGLWEAMTQGAALPSGMPPLPDVLEAIGEDGGRACGVLFLDRHGGFKVIAGVTWGDL